MQPLGGTAGAEDDHFEEMVDQLRADRASATRRRESWMRRQAAEDASLVGVLIGHAERRSTMAITTVTGNRYVGVLDGAGSEIVSVNTEHQRAMIRVAAIDTLAALAVQPRDNPEMVGHRGGADPISLGEVLSLIAADQPEVSFVTRSGERLGGELMAVGRDLVLVRPPRRGPLVYAPLSSLSEVLLPASTGSG